MLCQHGELAMKDSRTKELAAFVSALRFNDLPGPVVHQAWRFLLDVLGCAIGAFAEDERTRLSALPPRGHKSP